MSPIVLRLSDIRRARKWSQAELARQSGVSQATISRIEAGKTAGVDLRTLEKLSDALDVEPADLLLRQGRKRRLARHERGGPSR